MSLPWTAASSRQELKSRNKSNMTNVRVHSDRSAIYSSTQHGNMDIQAQRQGDSQLLSRAIVTKKIPLK